MDKVSRDPCDCGECEFCKFSLPPPQKSVIELMAELGPVNRTVTIGHFGCTCQFQSNRCKVCLLTEWGWKKCHICKHDNLKCTCPHNIEKKKEYYDTKEKLFEGFPKYIALQNISEEDLVEDLSIENYIILE
jgi:hypothetical protein